MTKRVGISIYPDQERLQDTLDYIDLAAGYGYRRIFTCLISEAGRTLEETVASFRKITAHARAQNMEIIADVAPEVFQRFGASWKDLRFFHQLGLSGIRLDIGFSGLEESIMSLNPYGLKLELNISNGTGYLENILSQCPDKTKLTGCHNFYPHRYTGLGMEHFLKTSRCCKKHGIHTAAFVNAPSADHGPWPVHEGLCTLEQHRSLSIAAQAKQLFATGLIDEVIIANAFASEAELEALADVPREIVTFRLDVEKGIHDTERRILFEELHFNRGDVSDYLIRSTQPRVKYGGEDLPAWNTPDLLPGDVVIESSAYPRYAGELQIVKRMMPNSGRSNVVAHIVEEERCLIDGIAPWQKFRFE